MNQKAPSSPIVPAIPKVKLTPTLPSNIMFLCMWKGSLLCSSWDEMSLLKWELKSLTMKQASRRGGSLVYFKKINGFKFSVFESRKTCNTVACSWTPTLHPPRSGWQHSTAFSPLTGHLGSSANLKQLGQKQSVWESHFSP